MIVIGLTGSIAMGKSTVTKQCELLGAHTSNADALAHQLMLPGGEAFEPIARCFPKAIKNGRVDRKTLGNIVFEDRDKLHMLESILHPLVIAAEERFVDIHYRMGTKIVVLDIPLLFETGGEQRMDMTMVVSAPAFIQRQRAFARPDMTEEKFRAILKQQLPDSKKRDYADVIIETGLGKACSMRQVKQVFAELGMI